MHVCRILKEWDRRYGFVDIFMHACNCFINRRWCRIKDGCGMRTRRLYFWVHPKPGLCLVHVAFKDIALLALYTINQKSNCANRLNIGKATINIRPFGSLPRIPSHLPVSLAPTAANNGADRNFPTRSIDSHIECPASSYRTTHLGTFPCIRVG